MAGLVPAIPIGKALRHPDRDHRYKAGDDKQRVIPARSVAEGKGIHTAAVTSGTSGFPPPCGEGQGGGVSDSL